MIFFCVYYFGVNIPYADDWYFLDHLQLYKQGKETISNICLSSLWEHLSGTGLVLTLLFAKVVGYNFKTILLLNICLLMVGFLILLKYSLKEFNMSLKNIPLWFIPVPFLWFSWVQADNILTAIHICLLISVVLSLLAFYFCYAFIKASRTNNALILFISINLSAILASFAMISGLFVWPIVIFNILIFTKNRIYKFAIIAVFIAVSLVYFVMRPILPHTSPSYIIKFLTEYARDPAYSLSYFISFFGQFTNYNYYVMSAGVCLLAGIIIISVIAYLVFLVISNRDLYRENIFLWSIIVYCIMIHSSVFYKSCHFYIGMPFFLPSRYASFNLPLIVAVYLLFVKICCNSNLPSSRTNYLAIALIFICVLHYVITPFTYIQPLTDKKVKSIFSLLDYSNKEDQSFYAITINDRQHVDAIRKIAPLMEKYSISIFNKDYLKKKYPLEYTLKYETNGEITRFPKNVFTFTGEWNFLEKDLYNSMSDGINLKLNPNFVVSSRSRFPNKAEIRSCPFMVSEDSFLYSQFILSGNFKNRVIGLDLNNDGVVEVNCESIPKPRMFKLFSRLFYVNPQSPYCFDVLFDLSDYKGKEVSLIVCHSGESCAEWIEFTQPVILKKSNRSQDK